VDTLTLDVESGGLDPTKDKLVLVGYRLNGGSYESFRPADGEAAPDAFTKALASTSVIKLGHNILFDIFFLKSNGYEIGINFDDTRLLAYLNDPFQDCRLKPLMKNLYNKEVIEFKDLTGKGHKKISTEAIDKAVLIEYNKRDVEYTDYLAKNLRPIPWYRDVEVPLMAVLYKAKEMGIFIDRQHVIDLKNKLEPEIEELRKGFGIINPNSPKQLLKEYARRQINSRQYSESGEPSTDKITLKRIVWKTSDSFSKELLRYRTIFKVYSTYVKTIIERTEKEPYLRGSFNQAGTESNSGGTRTGRLSSTDPNLQQIPTRTEIGKVIRKAFIPRPGYKMFVFDLKQIEPRVLAHYSQAKNLLEAFNNGEDTHRIMAASIFNKLGINVCERERFVGKTAWLEIVYGAYEKKIKWSIEKDSEEDPQITLEDCRKIRESFWTNNRAIASWRDIHLSTTRSLGYVTTLGGRKIPISEIYSQNRLERSRAERQAVNFQIQGSAADILKLITLEIDKKYGCLVRQLAWVHDEILGEIPLDYANDFFLRSLKNTMENTCKLKNLPIEAEGGFVNNWGEK
jgi:DNA polymerase-1